MKLKSLVVGAAAALTMVSPALADLTFPNLTYRTGPYAVNGIPYADGYADYMTLLNERDGGIGGEKINYIECETQYNTEKGVECYENTKGEGSLVYQPMSTGITYQLIRKPPQTAFRFCLWAMGGHLLQTAKSSAMCLTIRPITGSGHQL